jgi:hypothetical protein
MCDTAICFIGRAGNDIRDEAISSRGGHCVAIGWAMGLDSVPVMLQKVAYGLEVRMKRNF